MHSILSGTLTLLLTLIVLALPGAAQANPPTPEPATIASLQSPRSPVGLRVVRAAPGRHGLRPAEGPIDHFPEIDKVGAAMWTVEQGLVDEYSGDLDRLDSLARARRHRNLQGEIDGYYIDRIRRDNQLFDAGIRNGDVVHAVNGDPTRNTLQVIKAFYKHRKAKVIRVDLTRRGGRTMTLTYIIG